MVEKNKILDSRRSQLSAKKINENKKVAQKLKEFEEPYQYLFEKSPSGIVLMDMGGKVIECNSSVEKLFGYKKEELINRDFRKLPIFPNKKVPEIMKKLKMLIMFKDGILEPFDVQFKKKDDSLIWGLLQSSIIKLTDRSFVQLVIQNITERKIVEHELRVRINELDCLYGISKLIEDTEITLRERIEGIIDMIVFTWLSPELVCARITYDDIEYTTSNFEETEWNLSVHVKISEILCDVETYYFEEKQFSEDEIYLLHEIAIRLKNFLEKKIAEQKLKESEEKYRGILENMREGYFENDIQGNHTFLNDYFCEMLGYPKEEMLGKNFRNFYDDKTSEELFKKYNRVYETGNPLPSNTETELITLNGKRITIEGVVDLKYDSEGKKVGFFGLVRDITERKIAEQKLKESEEKYRLITENANDMIAIYNKKMIAEYVNEQAHLKVFGEIKEDLSDKPSIDRIHPEDLKIAAETIKKCFLEGEGNAEIRYKHKEGHWIWVEFRGKRFLDENGEEKALLVSRDITEKKNAEQKLKESEEKYRGILENMREGYFETDLRGNYTFLNDYYCTMFGYSKEEMLGKNFRRFYADKTGEDVFKRYNNLYN